VDSVLNTAQLKVGTNPGYNTTQGNGAAGFGEPLCQKKQIESSKIVPVTQQVRNCYKHTMIEIVTNKG
jgi:hypothetical protein